MDPKRTFAARKISDPSTQPDQKAGRRALCDRPSAIISLHTRTRSTLACLGWRPRAPRWALRRCSAGAGSRNFARNCTRLREHCKLRLRETWHENERIHEHARVTGRSGECERRLVADLVLHAARGGGELVGSICAWRRPREVSRARARQAVLMARAISIPDPSARLIDARKRACPKRSSRRIVRTRRG